MNTTESVLVAAAMENCQDEEDRSRLLHSLQSPDWTQADWDAESWQRFVPTEIRAGWGAMSAETRLAVYLTAKAGADRIGYAADRALDL